MGVINAFERVEKIFAKPGNFDVSGFAEADLITVELADALANLSTAEQKEFRNAGYKFHWFDETHTDGMIQKGIRGPKPGIHYNLRLYFNQKFPKEIEEAKKKGTVKDGNRAGDAQEPARN